MVRRVPLRGRESPERAGDDARRVAQMLGVDHHVFNYTDEFEEQVVAPFVRDHAEGRSPNPCIECNRHIKFDLLFERARRLGFDAVATGHHARVVERDGQHFLARGVDEHKDQSYVLGYLREEQLATLVLPIGALDKSDVRVIAQRLGLRTWDKPDSQDVCFIEAAKGRKVFLGQRISLTSAKIVDRVSGEVLGETDAAELMTVGQRRGVLPGRDGERRFVASVDIAAQRVEVGRLDDIVVDTIGLDAVSLTFAHDDLVDGDHVLAQWSAHGRTVPATLRRTDRWSLSLDQKVRPVAQGQTVVMYQPHDPAIVVGAAIVAAP